MKSRSGFNAYPATGPFLYSLGDGLVFELIVSHNVGSSQTLEELFNIGEVVPTEAWVADGLWN